DTVMVSESACGLTMDWQARLAQLVRLVGLAWQQPIVGSILRRNWWHFVLPNIFPTMSTGYFSGLRTSPVRRLLEPLEDFCAQEPHRLNIGPNWSTWIVLLISGKP